jgi:hypothetical protein
VRMVEGQWICALVSGSSVAADVPRMRLKNTRPPGEEARAQEWGKRLVASVVSSAVTDADRPGRPTASKGT